MLLLEFLESFYYYSSYASTPSLLLGTPARGLLLAPCKMMIATYKGYNPKFTQKDIVADEALVVNKHQWIDACGNIYIFLKKSDYAAAS